MENNENKNIETQVQDAARSKEISSVESKESIKQKELQNTSKIDADSSLTAPSDEQIGSRAWDIVCLIVLLILVIVCTYLLIK